MRARNDLKKTLNLSFAIVLLASIGLILLGNWQLRRLEAKENFIAKIKLNIANPSRKLEASDILNLYDKVELKGHFLADQVFLYGRRSAYPEKDGYYLLSSFKDVFGNIYLVSRAWLPQSAKEKLLSPSFPSEETITAFVMPGEAKSFFMPDNDIKNNIWFTIDLQTAKNQLNITNQNFYLMQVEAKNLPAGSYPLTSNYLAVIRNDHLEYAITWYSLAALLWLIYFLRYRRSVMP